MQILRLCILSRQKCLICPCSIAAQISFCLLVRPASHFPFMSSWSMTFWRCQSTARCSGGSWWRGDWRSGWICRSQPVTGPILSRFPPACWRRSTAQSVARRGSTPQQEKSGRGFTSRVWFWQISGYWPACLNEKSRQAMLVVKYGLLGDAAF